jgi:hypothetical protein
LLAWSDLPMVVVVVLGQVVRWCLARWSGGPWSGGQVVLPCVIARSGATNLEVETAQSPPHRPRGDERGVVLVQALLILPVLILIVFGSYTIWRAASVKHSLHTGTYQATRYLCLNPVDPLVPGIWEEVVIEIVAREVENNGMAHGASRPFANVTFFGNELVCGLRFAVETWVNLQIDMPYLSMPLTLRDRHEGWVECD